jgi:aspartate kinase
MMAVAELVEERTPCIVVLSAMSGITDKLVQIGEFLQKGSIESAREIIASMDFKYKDVVENLYSTGESKEKGHKLVQDHVSLLKSFLEKDFGEKEEKEILAQGEMMSTHFFLYYLQEIGKKASILPALDFMKINGDNEPDSGYIKENISNILKENSGADVYITQGYICRNSQGHIDNLQRGGSDYTATLVGAAIHAEEVQIWTDIDGVHNNDPRFVENTKPVTHLSYDEAAELAYFGAKILHPTSVIPCIKADTPIRLKNTMNPSAHGTLISSQSIGKSIKAIAAKDGITAIKVKSERMLLAYGFLRRVFEIFEKHRTPIDMITTSEVSVSLTIDNPRFLQEIVAELDEFASVEIDKDQTIVCIVGDLIAEKKHEAVEIFRALEDVPVRMISYGGSRHNISVLVPTGYKKQALGELSGKLFA